jgi:hypothetical protein
MGFLQPRTTSQKIEDEFGSGFYVRKIPRHTSLKVQTTRITNETSPLFERGWCYQERLLSRRILHFSMEELTFECRKHVRREYGESYKNKNTTPSLKINSTLSIIPGGWSSQRTLADISISWSDIVMQYSQKSLSFLEDRLPALSGVASRIRPTATGPYMADIWEKDLLRGLCWQPFRATEFQHQLKGKAIYCSVILVGILAWSCCLIDQQ